MEKEIYYRYFEENLKPDLLQLEQFRKKLALKVVFVSILYFLLGLACAALFVFGTEKNFLNPLIIPVILFFMYVFFIKSIINFIISSKNYRNKLHKEVLPLFFPPVANFKVWPKNQNTSNILESKLFPNFNTQQDSLSIFGFYNKCSVQICNTCLSTSEIKNLFKGTVIQIGFEKSINNHIIMISKNEHKFNHFKQIKTEISELNSFLYTFSEKNSTNFITEEFWQVLKQISENYIAKGFLLSFKNNEMLICLRQKRPLRFGFLFKSLLKPENYDELIERFIVIYKLIDCIKI